jgi:hypothetical protein
MIIISSINKPEYKIAEEDIEVFLPLEYKEYELFGKKLTLYSKIWWLKFGKLYRRFLKVKEYQKHSWIIKGFTTYSQKTGYITTYGKERLYRAVVPKGAKYYESAEGIPEYFKSKGWKINYHLCSNKIRIIDEEIVLYLGPNVDKKYSYVHLGK